MATGSGAVTTQSSGLTGARSVSVRHREEASIGSRLFEELLDIDALQNRNRYPKHRAPVLAAFRNQFRLVGIGDPARDRQA